MVDLYRRERTASLGDRRAGPGGCWETREGSGDSEIVAKVRWCGVEGHLRETQPRTRDRGNDFEAVRTIDDEVPFTPRNEALPFRSVRDGYAIHLSLHVWVHGGLICGSICYEHGANHPGSQVDRTEHLLHSQLSEGRLFYPEVMQWGHDVWPVFTVRPKNEK